MRMVIGLLCASCVATSAFAGDWPRTLESAGSELALDAIEGARIVPSFIPNDAFDGIEADTVDSYLCWVYWRMPIKVDSSGDFTWKDPAAAKRRGMTTCQFAILGMHREFREILFEFGKIADLKGIYWSFLSAFRDNYRQHIAEGLKAGDCGSWHGGSCRTKGYGDGRAVDIWTVRNGKPGGDVDKIFYLVDDIGTKLGIHRPMPGSDPAHVQPTSSRMERMDGKIVVAKAEPESSQVSVVRRRQKKAERNDDNDDDDRRRRRKRSHDDDDDD